MWLCILVHRFLFFRIHYCRLNYDWRPWKRNHKLYFECCILRATKSVIKQQNNTGTYFIFRPCCVLLSCSLCSCGSRRSKPNPWRQDDCELILRLILPIQRSAEWRHWLVPRNFGNLKWLPSSRHGNSTHGLCSGNARKEKWFIRHKLQVVSFYWWR